MELFPGHPFILRPELLHRGGKGRLVIFYYGWGPGGMLRFLPKVARPRLNDDDFAVAY
jgi:hypothetical protein